MIEKWILRPNPAPKASLRLFCCHPAGRGASTFTQWANLLPSEVELCCVQLPGRENRLREAPITRLVPIIDILEECLFPLLDRPYALFGASMGALLAFELARRLRQTYSILPVHLILASRRAPQAPERLPLIAHLPDDRFMEEVIARYNSIPDVILNDKELMTLFRPLLRADFSVIETYSYQPDAPLDCPLTIFRGSEDKIVLPEDIVGWEAHTSRQFYQHTYEGSHFFFNERPGEVVKQIFGKLFNIHS